MSRTEPNRLTNEASPYLLQHANNPVDWYPWGDEGFDRARAEDKPIFLSIGYATCYWCHVMERQVFENDALAAKMNKLFVCVKVDREQRPDVDDLYMTATQLMTQRGGWPMSVFLTPPGAGGDDDPGLKPFWCGTYIPPEPTGGIAGFGQVLDGINDAWHNQRQVVLDQAARLSDAIGQKLTRQAGAAPLTKDMVEKAVAALLESYDQQHAGFGGAPKFPQPSNLLLLMRVVEIARPDDLWPVVAQTLDRMARGGLFDQVGGGFHRYCVDQHWLVPHFEKMLYDNGQLLTAYATAIGLDEDPARKQQYERVIRETVAWLNREMLDDNGLFYCAIDAEVDGREGGNYIWAEQQVRDAIDDGQLAELAVDMYGLADGPNFKDPHHDDATPANVLYLKSPLTELAVRHKLDMQDLLAKRDAINEQLLHVRNARPQPITDDKHLTAWNGMAITGLATAAQALGDRELLELAQRCADACLTHMVVDGQLKRTLRDGRARPNAFLEDYAQLAAGLIAVHRAGAALDGAGDDAYLQHARTLTDAAIDLFACEFGGYFDTGADQRDLLLRATSTYDGATPTGNSQMIHNLVDLDELTGDSTYLHRAGRDLRSFATLMTQRGGVMLHMIHALLRFMTRPGGSSLLEPQPGDATAEPTDQTTPRMTAMLDGFDRDASTQRLKLLLKIAEGMHISAEHEPSVAIDDEQAKASWQVRVDWPEPTEAQPAFADEPMRVWQDNVTLPISLDWQGEGEMPAVPPTLALVVQLCDDTACHKPESFVLNFESALG